MKTFEEQTIAAIRRLAKWMIVLSVFLLATLALATWAYLQAQSGLDQARADAALARATATELAAQVHSKNHVKDVLLWCDAINADRAYNKTFVQRVTRGKVTYTLAALPCEAIANRARATTSGAPSTQNSKSVR